MSSDPVVGIDLGTTYSCVSIYRRDRPELVINADGKRLIPSIVYFNPNNGNVSVGETAEDNLIKFPKNALLDAKRFIGRKYDDVFISQYMESNKSNFSLVRGPNDEAAFEIEINGETVIKRPEEVSAEVLKHLKSMATNYLGEIVDRAVISVPAYFSNAQRQATMTAAELAGLTVLKLITEPTAAAIHYVTDRNRLDSRLLVFDFGGGTLDLSLIDVKDGKFEVKAVYGDTLLGGRKLDEVLFDHFYPKFSQLNESFASRIFKRRLNQVCQYVKEKLSTEEECTRYISMWDGNADLDVSIERETFEELGEGLFKQIDDLIRLCLSDSGSSASDIDEVVLVGGSVRIPRIRKLLARYFGEEKIVTNLNPDEAVAAGTSIHAAYLTRNNKDLECYKVTEVTPMSLGMRINSKLMHFFLPKHSQIPAVSSKTIYTLFNNQSSLLISIYEGERKNVDYNNKLSEFRIDLPKKRAGDVSVTVKFNLDENGILSVTARETSTGRDNKLVVTMGRFRLSDRRIKRCIADAIEHKAEDDIFEEFEDRRGVLWTNCNRVLFDIDEVSPESDRSLVRNCCEEFINVSKELGFNEIEKLNEQYAKLKKEVSHILAKNSIYELR